jgi:hypothetical protein
MFAPYELVWAGGMLGRVLAQGIYWGARPAERIGQGLARYRERARTRQRERLAARSGQDKRQNQQHDPPVEPAASPATPE